MSAQLSSVVFPLRSSVGYSAYPFLDSKRQVEVAIVGSGLTALTAALELYRAGQRVAIVAPAALIDATNPTCVSYFDSVEPSTHARWFADLGLEQATEVAAAYRDSIGELQVQSAKLSECHFASVPALTVAEFSEDLIAVERECTMGRALHGDCWFTGDVRLPFPAAGASRDKFQGKLQLTPLLRAMASELHMLGGEIYEHSPCTAPPRFDRACEIKTERGSICANSVIFAGRTPFAPMVGHIAEQITRHSYMIAVQVAETLDDAIYVLDQVPRRIIWRADRSDSSRLIIRADYFGDQGSSQPRCLNELCCYASSRFSVKRVEARWSHHQLMAPDGLPIVGRVPANENAYVAGGLGQQELPWGIAAGKLLSNLIQGKSSPVASILDPKRVTREMIAKQPAPSRMKPPLPIDSAGSDSPVAPYYPSSNPTTPVPALRSWGEWGMSSPLMQNFIRIESDRRWGGRPWRRRS